MTSRSSLDARGYSPTVQPALSGRESTSLSPQRTVRAGTYTAMSPLRNNHVTKNRKTATGVDSRFEVADRPASFAHAQRRPVEQKYQETRHSISVQFWDEEGRRKSESFTYVQPSAVDEEADLQHRHLREHETLGADRSLTKAELEPVCRQEMPRPDPLCRLSAEERDHLVRSAAAMKSASTLFLPKKDAAAEHKHEHEHGCGGVVDLDELVHGIYAAAVYGIQAAKNGPETLMAQFKEEATLWHDNALNAMKDGVLPHSEADFSLGLGVAGALAPLAVLALMAGIHEMAEARHTGKQLTDEQRRVAEMINSLRQLQSREGTTPADIKREIEAFLAQHQEQKDRLELASRQNELGGKIGLGSAWSGASILGGVGTKVGVQIPLVGVAHGVGGAADVAASSAAAGVAATAAGMAGSLVLGPLAGLGAAYLGYHFERKSSEKRKALLESTGPTRDYLRDVQQAQQRGQMPEVVEAYRHFFDTKSAQREKFYKNFNGLNRLFLAGSSVYASGAVGKACIAGLALGGVAVASHPIGLAALLAMGIAGGLTMGAGSLQFITGHGRQHRYDSYFMDDHPRLDRGFLAAADLLPPSSEAQQQHAGVALRAHLYNTLRSDDLQRREFLRDVADKLGKHHGRSHRSTDLAEVLNMRTQHRPSIAKRAQAWAAAAGTFVRKVVTGHGLRAAASAARASHARHTDRLAPRTLADWLVQPHNHQDQISFMLGQLQRHAADLEMRREMREMCFDPRGALAAQLAEQHNATDEEKKAKKQVAEFLGQQSRGALREGALLAHMRVLVDDLHALRNDPSAPRRLSRNNGSSEEASPALRLALARERFMCVQSGLCYDMSNNTANVQASSRHLAEFLLKDWPDQYTTLRGQLLEAEMQATRLREKAAELAGQQAPNPIEALSQLQQARREMDSAFAASPASPLSR